MLASLVVVLPTRHEGGALVFRHRDQEYKFDSAKAVHDATKLSVAYAAFYSDVEHEVEPVVSGYRVTLTYNLYLTRTASSKAHENTPAELVLKAAFEAMLADKKFLPKGGLVGFGLRQELAVSSIWSAGTANFAFKGSDAVLQNVCNQLSLETDLRIIYKIPFGQVFMASQVLDKEDDSYDVETADYILEEYEDAVDVLDSHRHEITATVHWATVIQPSHITPDDTPCIAYGNDPWIEHMYSTLSLIVEIPTAKERGLA